MEWQGHMAAAGGYQWSQQSAANDADARDRPEGFQQHTSLDRPGNDFDGNTPYYRGQVQPDATLSPSLIMQTLRQHMPVGAAAEGHIGASPQGPPQSAASLSLSPLSLASPHSVTTATRPFVWPTLADDASALRTRAGVSVVPSLYTEAAPMHLSSCSTQSSSTHNAVSSGGGGLFADSNVQQSRASSLTSNPLLNGSTRPPVTLEQFPLTREEREGLSRFDVNAIQDGAQRYLEAEDSMRALNDRYDEEVKEYKQSMANNLLFMKLYLRRCLNHNTTVGQDGDQEQLSLKPTKGRCDRAHILQCSADTLMYVTCDKCAARSKRAIAEANEHVQRGTKTIEDYQPQESFPELYDKRYAYVFNPQKALSTSIAIADMIEKRLPVEYRVIVQRIPGEGSGKRKPKRRDTDIVVTVPPERL